MDGKLEARINGSRFPHSPMADCNPNSKVYVGDKGITLGGLQVHPRALTAQEFVEMHKIGATIGDLARRPAISTQDEFALLTDTSAAANDEASRLRVLRGADVVSLDNANDYRMDLVMSDQSSSGSSAGATTAKLFESQAVRCVVGSRCALRVKRASDHFSLSPHNTAVMSPVIRGVGQRTCSTAAINAARAHNLQHPSMGRHRWAVPALPVLANTAPRRPDGGCPRGSATYAAGGAKWPCTVTTERSPYEQVDKQHSEVKSVQLHLRGTA